MSEGVFEHITSLTYENDSVTRFYSDQDLHCVAPLFERPSCLFGLE